MINVIFFFIVVSWCVWYTCANVRHFLKSVDVIYNELIEIERLDGDAGGDLGHVGVDYEEDPYARLDQYDPVAQRRKNRIAQKLYKRRVKCYGEVVIQEPLIMEWLINN